MFTMINTIGGVVIMVSDQAQAVKFYTEKIGFEEDIEDDLEDVEDDLEEDIKSE